MRESGDRSHSKISEGKNMFLNIRRPQTAGLLFAYLWLVLVTPAFAAGQFSVHGTVKDSSGAVISGAKIELLQDQHVVAETASDREGNYQLKAQATGKYQVCITASSFQVFVSNPMEASQTEEAQVNATLKPE